MDSAFSTLAMGHHIIPITGYPARPNGVVIPDDEWLIVSKVGSDTTSLLSILTDSTVIAYRRNNNQSTETEQFRYTGGESHIFVCNPDTGPREYYFDMTLASPDSEVTCFFDAIETSSGDSTRFEMTTDSLFRIDNFGAATIYDSRLRIASSTVDDWFYRDSLEIPANTSQKFIPDWRQTGDSLTILVDVGMTGTFDDTLRVENQGPPCECLFQSDFDEDGFLTALDLSAMIDILFSGNPDVQDGFCPNPRADYDCDGFSTALDLSALIDHLFSGGAGPCDPCSP